MYTYPYQQYPYPVYPQYQPQALNVNAVTTPSNPLILDTVSGRTAADIYNVDMGKQAILIDIDNPVIYKKSRDMDNKLEMIQYDLIPHIDEPKVTAPQINLDEYVRKDTVDKIVEDRVKEEVDKRLSEISFTPKTTRKKASEE